MRAGISCSEVFQIVVKVQAKHHADIIGWSSPYLLFKRNQLPGSKDQSLGIPQAELESRALELSGEDRDGIHNSIGLLMKPSLVYFADYCKCWQSVRESLIAILRGLSSRRSHIRSHLPLYYARSWTPNITLCRPWALHSSGEDFLTKMAFRWTLVCGKQQ